MTNVMYFCVDAGGSSSAGRLYSATGVALANAEDGPANANYDLEQTLRSVQGLWTKLCAAAGCDPSDYGSVSLAIGGAGLYVQRARDALRARVPAFNSVVTMSDGYAALIGASGGKPSSLVTIGTGVAGHRLFGNGTSIQRDGRGWIVGDRGGGVWLGIRAIRHFMEVQDGIRPASALSEAVLNRIGGMAGFHNGALSNLTPQRLASFAPMVLDKADEGCPVSWDLVARAVGWLTDLVRVLDSQDVPLYLNGGLSEALRPRLVEKIKRSVARAEGDPLQGCLLVAMGEAPTEQVVLN